MLSYGSMLLVVLATAIGMKKINTHFTPEPLPMAYTRYAEPATICHGQIVGDCLKGNLSSDKEVLVLGDSHAAMLNHFFDYLGKEIGFKARIITASSCVTIPRFDYQRIPGWAQKNCLRQIDVANTYISTAAIIVIAASWDWHFNSAEYEKAVIAFLTENARSKILLMPQEPLLKQNPMRALRFENIGLHGVLATDPAYKKKITG